MGRHEGLLKFGLLGELVEDLDFLFPAAGGELLGIDGLGVLVLGAHFLPIPKIYIF